MTHTAAYTITGSTLSLFLDGAKSIISKDHPNFDAIVAALKDRDYDSVPALIDIPKAMTDFTLGAFSYIDGVLSFRGQPASSWLTDKVRQLMQVKMPIDALLGFHNHLSAHRSFRVRQQLEAWLDRAKMPITADGHFLAWKYVRQDWKDCHSGTFDNSVGQTVAMPRDQVDDDPTHTCSAGLHVCSFDYLPQTGGGQRIVLVKVYVDDVVSIPTDYNHTKMRVCRYTVLQEVKDPSKGFFDSTPVYEEPTPPEPTHRVLVRALNTESGNIVESTYDVAVPLYEDIDGDDSHEQFDADGDELDERNDFETEEDAKTLGIERFQEEHDMTDLTDPPVVVSVEAL